MELRDYTEPTYEPQILDGWQDAQLAKARAEVQQYEAVQAMQQQEALAAEVQPGPPADTPEKQFLKESTTVTIREGTASAGEAPAPPVPAPPAPSVETTQAPPPAETIPRTPETEQPGVIASGLQRDPAMRFARNIGSGFLRGVQNLLAAPEAFGLVGANAPVGRALQDARQTLAGISDTLSPDDPNVLDRFGQAIGTMAFSFVPGLTAAGVVQKGVMAVQGLAKAGALVGGAVSSGLEAAQEMGDVYDTLKGLVGEEEAQSRARWIFAKNLPLLFLSNRVGIFADVGRGITRFLAGASLEGVQEVLQYDISRKAFTVPGTHPLAEQLETLGWVRRGGQVEQPFQFTDALEAGVMGAILGGGAAVVTGRALEQEAGTMYEMLKGPEAEQIPGPLGDFLRGDLGQAVMAAQEQEGGAGQGPPLAQRILSAIGNERGAIGVPGGTVPEGQPSPEQLGLGGIPQQTTFTLPENLARAKPTAGQVPLEFADDLDKAMYIVGNPATQSAQHQQYLQSVMDWLRLPEQQAMQQAIARRGDILRYVRTHGKAGQPLQIPAGATAAAPATGAPRAGPGGMPTEQMPLPALIGRSLGEAQGLPMLDANTVAGLRTFLKTADSDALVINGKPLEINYQFLQTDEGVKRVLAAVSDIYATEIAAVREPQSREQTRAEALRMGMTVQQFLETDRENLVSRKKAILAREMTVASARQLKIGTAMFNQGSLSGRDLTRLFATHAAIQTQFSRLANEAGGALSIFAANVEGDLSSLRGYEQILEYLGSSYTPQGLADLIDAVPTEQQLQLFMDQLPKATAKQMLLEAWYGAMFSGVTLFKNLFGNAAMIGEGYLNRVVAARLPGKAVGLQEAMRRTMVADQAGLTLDERRAALADREALFQRDIVTGEANAFAAGMLASVHEAWAAAKIAFTMGEQQIGEGKIPEAALGKPKTLPSGQVVRQPAITGQNVRELGRTGRILAAGPLGTVWDGIGLLARAVSRGMIATDEFAKVMNKRGELHALAWRKAVMEQLVGGRSQSEVLDSMQDFIDRPPPAADRLADARAAEHTLTKPFQELGAFGRAAAGLDDAANYSIVWRYFAPFVRVVTNAVYWNMERFPIIAPTMKQVREDLQMGGARGDMAKAKMLTGMSATMLIVAMAWKGILRGDPEEREKRGLKEAKGTRSYTFVVPGTTIQIPFKPIEPFGMFIGTMTDWTEAVKQAGDDPTDLSDLSHMLMAGIVAAGSNIFSQSWTQNMMNMNELLFDRGNEEERESRFRRFANQLGKVPVPSLVRQIESMFDPQIAEVQNALDAFKSGIPGVTKEPELDFWGQPRTTSTTGLGLEAFNPFVPSVDKSLQYGPPTKDGVRDALARKDLEALRVWVTEELLTAQIPVSRPSAVLLAKQRGGRVQDDPIRLRPKALNELRRLFALEIKDDSGRTLPESMAAVMLTDGYQKGTDGPEGSKASQIQKVVKAFKDAAEAKFIQDNDKPDAPHADVVRKHKWAEQARVKHRHGIRVGQP